MIITSSCFGNALLNVYYYMFNWISIVRVLLLQSKLSYHNNHFYLINLVNVYKIAILDIKMKDLTYLKN